ncbi:hypothetical protein [Sphingobium sp.]|uniref:hypothetical protein n=1 Tax=Sphingobium sp. TaxID=1912891 RepID=UPI002CF9E543|nr:hypothetical protein [Sphingobium sp.]HUD92885.1 hypothetical protein [Sphingobium sp.]
MLAVMASPGLAAGFLSRPALLDVDGLIFGGLGAEKSGSALLVDALPRANVTWDCKFQTDILFIINSLGIERPRGKSHNCLTEKSGEWC